MLVLLDGEGLEASLPDVAGGMVVALVSADVEVHQTGHPGAQVAVLCAPEDEVEVVGHEAVGEDAKDNVGCPLFPSPGGSHVGIRANIPTANS